MLISSMSILQMNIHYVLVIRLRVGDMPLSDRKQCVEGLFLICCDSVGCLVSWVDEGCSLEGLVSSLYEKCTLILI